MPDKNDKKYPKLNEALYLDPKSLSSMKYIMETIMLIALATKNEIEEQKITDQNSVMIKRLKELEKFSALSQELWVAFSNQKPVDPKELLEWSNQANRLVDVINPRISDVKSSKQILARLEAELKEKSTAPLLEKLETIKSHANIILKNSTPRHKTVWLKFSGACKKFASQAIKAIKNKKNEHKLAEQQRAIANASLSPSPNSKKTTPLTKSVIPQATTAPKVPTERENRFDNFFKDLANLNPSSVTAKKQSTPLEDALFLIDLQMDTLLERMPEKGKLTEEEIKSLLETVKINLYNNLNSDGTVNGLLNEADFERLKAHLKERLKNEAHESDEEINSFLEGVEIEYLLMDQGVSLTPVIPVARTGTSSQPKTNRSDDFDTLYKELKAVDNAKLAPVLFSQNKKDRTSLPMPIIPRVDYETCKNNIIAALKDPAPADSNFKFTNTIRNAIYASLANEFKYGADVLVKRTLSPDDFDKLKSDLRSYFMQFMPEEKPLKGEESEYQLDLPQVREMIKIMNFIDNLSKTLPEEEKLAMQKLQDKSPPARPSVNLSEDNPSHPRRPGSGKI